MNRSHLRFARASAYIAGISDLAYWIAALREAERELDAATRLADVNAAASAHARAKEALKRAARG